LSKKRQQNLQDGQSGNHHRPSPAHDTQSAVTESEQLSSGAITAGKLNGLPNRPLRRQAILQLQRTHGNAFVMRHVMPQLQRQDEEQPAAETREGAGEQEMSSGGAVVGVGPSSVDISGPIVNISGGMTNIDSGITNVSGVLRASTLIADSVVAASYSPGAGNVM
jgi:hypothetical protein